MTTYIRLRADNTAPSGGLKKVRAALALAGLTSHARRPAVTPAPDVTPAVTPAVTLTPLSEEYLIVTANDDLDSPPSPTLGAR